jgi:hypothetical protein
LEGLQLEGLQLEGLQLEGLQLEGFRLEGLTLEGSAPAAAPRSATAQPGRSAFRACDDSDPWGDSLNCDAGCRKAAVRQSRGTLANLAAAKRSKPSPSPGQRRLSARPKQ